MASFPFGRKALPDPNSNSMYMYMHTGIVPPAIMHGSIYNQKYHCMYARAFPRKCYSVHAP